jgi:hypothetical protein
MSPKKLTEADKAKILVLYRQTSETTSTLAEQFGVSSSTISRFLKGMLSNQEYENLIHQKRLARGPKSDSQLALTLETPATTTGFSLEMAQSDPLLLISAQPLAPTPTSGNAILLEAEAQPEPNPLPILRTRRRRSSASVSADSLETEMVVSPPPEAPQASGPAPPPSLEKPASPPPPSRPKRAMADIDLSAIVKDLDDDLIDEEELEEEDDDEDLEDDLDEVWEETDGDDTGKVFLALEDAEIQVRPFSEAILPPSCYLVTDRSAELVVRPLKEFAHLGKIPAEEVQQKTLPVFDNHRVARRFSNRFQKVIKIPDSRLLQKTLGHLRSKGITRIFLDGKVYQLGPS